MNNTNKAEWVLRVAVFGEFFGHGIFAIRGREDWVGWIQMLSGMEKDLAENLLTVVGAMDMFLGLLVLVKVVPIALLWMTFWGFWTALVRPLVGTDVWGKDIWDFVERWANWGAPLTLFFLYRARSLSWWR